MNVHEYAGRGQGIVQMPIMSPVRIDTDGLPFWKKTAKYFERRKWEIIEDYYLFVPYLNEILFIPKGFIFDCASVPRFLWPVINPTGVLLVGSLFHDFGYIYNCFLNKDMQVIHDKEEDPRKFFDDQIRDINIYINGYNFMNKAAWQALRMFAWIPWKGYRKTEAVVGDLLQVFMFREN